MNRLYSTCAVLALLGATSVFAAGSITGKVVFKGTAPKAEAIKMSSDAACEKAAAGKKVYKNDVVVNSNGTLADVFVYVKEGVKKDGLPPVAGEITFDQRGCMYHPKAFGIRTGQTMTILNSDKTMHNIHAMPTKGNTGFNNAIPGGGTPLKKTFTKPELGLKIKCDVHSWMLAHANVVDHPYFAVTNEKGVYTIPNLPAGEYTLEAYHANEKEFPAQTAKVTVTEGGAQTTDFTFIATKVN